MNTYLLTWNPAKWPWDDLGDCIQDIRKNGVHSDRWSCGQSKKIVKGDRLCLIRLGQEPRGIMASGWATSNVFEDEHWDTKKRKAGQSALYVTLDFDVLLYPHNQDSILSREKLREGVLKQMHWDTQTSGINIPNDVATQLEIEWARFLANKRIIQRQTVEAAEVLPEEVVEDKKYFEGAKKQIVVNSYERNTDARKKCIEHYGLNCYTCGFNFEKAYGDLGVGFIHVHHLKPLAEVNERYELDPIKDLRPVCPNCHAMIHHGKQMHSIEEVRKIWEDELNK